MFVAVCVTVTFCRGGKKGTECGGKKNVFVYLPSVCEQDDGSKMWLKQEFQQCCKFPPERKGWSELKVFFIFPKIQICILKKKGTSVIFMKILLFIFPILSDKGRTWIIILMIFSFLPVRSFWAPLCICVVYKYI